MASAHSSIWQLLESGLNHAITLPLFMRDQNKRGADSLILHSVCTSILCQLGRRYMGKLGAPLTMMGILLAANEENSSIMQRIKSAAMDAGLYTALLELNPYRRTYGSTFFLTMLATALVCYRTQFGATPPPVIAASVTVAPAVTISATITTTSTTTTDTPSTMSLPATASASTSVTSISSSFSSPVSSSSSQLRVDNRSNTKLNYTAYATHEKTIEEVREQKRILSERVGVYTDKVKEKIQSVTQPCARLISSGSARISSLHTAFAARVPTRISSITGKCTDLIVPHFLEIKERVGKVKSFLINPIPVQVQATSNASSSSASSSS